MNLHTALNTTLFGGSTSERGAFSFFSPVTTKKGVPVNANSALNLSAFFNGIEIICNDYAKLPKSVFKKVENGREKVSNHPVSFLMSGKVNRYMTRFVFDKLMIMDAILKGNGFAIIYRDKAGFPVEILYVDQSETPVEIIKAEDGKYFKINGDYYNDADIVHYIGFTKNGISGIGVVSFAALSLGVALSSQEFSSEYYAHKGITLGVAETDKHIDGPKRRIIQDVISESFRRADLYKVPVLDDGIKFKQLSITPEEAKFLQTNKYGVEEVARWLNLPPHKLKMLDNATYSNIENQSIQHVQDSMLPWSTKFEQEEQIKLFSIKNLADGFYIRHNIAVLLRADLKTKAEFYNKMVLSGIYTRNEVRALEEMNSLNGLNEPLTPVNTQSQEQIDKALKGDE